MAERWRLVPHPVHNPANSEPEGLQARMSRTRRVPLQPMIVPGPVWRRHRHFLIPDRRFDSTRHFNVLDETTGRLYAWDIWPPGSTTIGVPTTWTYLHRGWTDHMFYLVEEPERTCDMIGKSIRGKLGIRRRALTWLRSRVV
jgi:hypothetical protein